MLPPPDDYIKRTQSNRNRPPVPAPTAAPPTPATLPAPLPLGVEAPVPVTGALSEHEALIIVKTSLRDEFQNDPKILALINSYVGNRDQRQAAREAGLPFDYAKRILARKDVVRCVGEITKLSALKYGIDAAEIVERVKEMGDSDMADFHDPVTGRWISDITQVPPRTRRAVKGFKVRNTYEVDTNGIRMTDANGNLIVKSEIIEVDFYDKQKAQELLGREFNLFKEKKVVENDIGSNMRDLLLGAAHRADARIADARDVSPAAEAAYRLMKPPSEVSGE